MNRGVLFAVTAYAIWGVFPLYWKQLGVVPPDQQVGHRIAWSCLLLLLVLPLRGHGREVWGALRSPRVVAVYLAAALMLGVNWLVYLWAVQHGFIVEASLGYFINPLLSVLLGVVFLRERLRIGQWTAVALAAAGVAYLTVVYGALPWIGLALALAFGLYGLIRKIGPLGSIPGLTLEMGILVVPTLVFLIGAETRGAGAFGHHGLRTDLLLAGAGLVTTVPLLLFTAAARRIPLSVLGIIQYITPTGQFLLGVFKYGEPFSRQRALGFVLVWIALAVFTVEGLLARRGRGRSR